MADGEKPQEGNVARQDYNEKYFTRAFKCIRVLVHSIGAAQFIYAAVSWKYSGRRQAWGGKYQFLTYLNVLLQSAYHSIALLNDIFGSNALDPQPVPCLRKIRDYVFSALALPISFNVSLNFWIVYAYNRELIFRRSLDAVFPTWLNHLVHTNVTLFIFLDMLTCFRRFPKRTHGILLTSMAALSYIGWLHIAQYHNGRWAYPMLNASNTPMRYVMFSSIIGLNIAAYLCGEYINNLIWDAEFRLLQQKP